jgi:hypothetical protein
VEPKLTPCQHKPQPSEVLFCLLTKEARRKQGKKAVHDHGAQVVARGAASCESQVLNRGAQVDARGATQVLDRGGQAVACGSSISQVTDRGA